MKPLLSVLSALAFLPLPAVAADPLVEMPDFPLPAFAMDDAGRPQEMGMIRIVRGLQKGGVTNMENLVAVDNQYAVISSDCLPMLSAWLEMVSQSIGIDLKRVRTQTYDGGVYGQLLEVATTIATVRQTDYGLAVPIGVMTCKRSSTWGSLPGDGKRDAYLLIATDQGFLVYDPPTEQAALLANYPNHSGILKIQF